MTVADVKEAILAIKQVDGDDEVQHSREDDLHQAVLQAIAEGVGDNPADLAREALKTSKIQFYRWCA